MKVLVVGLGITGSALVRHAGSRGWDATVVEDDPAHPGYAERRADALASGARVVEAPGADDLARLVADADLVVPSPGVPVHHPVYEAARRSGADLVSEIELASVAATRPIVAVTGTNGKTTVTTLVTEVLEASGVSACAAGNIGRPLLDAVGEPVDVVVAEVSSFQLQYTRVFRPGVAVVLNVSHDHLDWHPTFEHYRAAKARIFANQGEGDVAVANADNPVAAAMAADLVDAGAPVRVERFSTAGAPGAFRVEGGALVTPEGERIVAVGELARRHPHDLANGLAAAAAGLAAGATLDGAGAALRAHRGLPHRLSLVGEAVGVEWYDDSKATNPHATLAALEAFDSVVLLAGGRNKGLALDPLAEAAPRVRVVVAFGEAGADVEAVFAGRRPVERVTTIREAVEKAAALARPGDAVVLSPACASFDAYPNYAARGDDFASEVRRLLHGFEGPSGPSEREIQPDG